MLRWLDHDEIAVTAFFAGIGAVSFLALSLYAAALMHFCAAAAI
jgi:hypothetical protein